MGKAEKKILEIFILSNTWGKKSQQCEAMAWMQMPVTVARSSYSIYSDKDTNLLSFNFLLNFQAKFRYFVTLNCF